MRTGLFLTSRFAGLAAPIVIVAAVLVTPSGCTSDGSSDRASSDAGPSDAGAMLPDEVQKFIDDYCAISQPCCTSLSAPDCQSNVAWDAKHSGRFDAARGAACLAAARQAATSPDFCGRSFDFPACQNVFSGTKGPGEACDRLHRYEECAPVDDGFSFCDGYCVTFPRAKVGDACAFTLADDHLYYDFDKASPVKTSYGVCYKTDGLHCDNTTKKCVTTQAAGGPCDPVREDECADGDYCALAEDPDGGVSSRCAPRIPSNGVCKPESCVAGYTCDRTTKRCVPNATVGTPCASSNDLGVPCWNDDSSSSVSVALVCQDGKCAIDPVSADTSCSLGLGTAIFP